MLTLKLISEETERVIKGLEKKHFNGAKEAIDNVLALDKTRRETQQKLDKNLQECKLLSAQIGSLMKEKKTDEANAIKENVSKLKESAKNLEHQLDKTQEKLTELLCTIPNIPNDDVPEGKDASDNVIVKEGGQIPDLPEDALCHWDLCKKIQFNKLRFRCKNYRSRIPYIYRKDGTFSKSARSNFFLKKHVKADTWKYNLHM